MGREFLLTDSRKRPKRASLDRTDPKDLMFQPKRERGRPAFAASEVVNRASDFDLTFNQCKDQIDWDKLRNAKSKRDLNKAFANINPSYLETKFRPRYPLILEIVNEPTFPKRSIKAQIRFLAESLGADGHLSFRRSRNICAEERRKPKHKIIRREFYLECTCGYKGPALDGGCRKCGTGMGFMEKSLSLPQGKHFLEP
jgi:hypothetical protein